MNHYLHKCKYAKTFKYGCLKIPIIICFLQKDIKNLGGTVVESYDDDGSSKPFCIITDHPRASYLEKLKSGKVAPQVG